MADDERSKRMLRPEMTVLPDDAVFTHEVTTDAPFTHVARAREARPKGTMAAGTKVILLGRDGKFCRVADSSGIEVVVRCDTLREL